MFNMIEASKRDWPSSGIPKVGFSRKTNVGASCSKEDDVPRTGEQERQPIASR